jgi:hypothetical protein
MLAVALLLCARLFVFQCLLMHETKLRQTAACLAFVFLSLSPLGPHSSSIIRLASGQGLPVSADNLGAGAEATATEFEQFEAALELATTGGRGR